MTSEAEPQAHRPDLDSTPFRASTWLTRCCPFAGTRGRRHKKPVPEIPSMPEVSGAEKAVASNALATPAPTVAPTVAVPVAPLRREAFLEPLEPAASTAGESPERQQLAIPEAQVNSSLLASPVSSGTSTSGEADSTLRKTGLVAVPLIEQFEARLDLGGNVGANVEVHEKNTMEPAAEVPSWWVGKDPVPIELLEDSGDASLAPMANLDIETLLPPLPSLRPQWIPATPEVSPCKTPPEESPPRSTGPTDSAETVGDVEAADSDPQPAPPILRPRSYRNSLKCARTSFREKGGHRGTSLSQEQKPHLGSSVSSRPTTAGAETASTYSTSWREEWTPGSKPIEKNPNVGFVLPVPLGARPPPLPPLPTKPPEQGSLPSQSEVGLNQASSSPSGTSTSTYKVDDAALRRICQSKSVNAATPPPLDWRRLGSQNRASDMASNDDRIASTIEDAESILKESPCAEHEDEAVNGVEFSELACAFATLEA